MKALLYCTNAKPYLSLVGKYDNGKNYYEAINDKTILDNALNGKVLAECDYEVEEIKPEKYWHSTEDFDYIYNTGTVYYDDLLKKSCLMDYELDDYLGCEDKGYAIHIKNLHIFNEPMELWQFYSRAVEIDTIYGSYWCCTTITKVQNMMYVQDENQDKQYALIPVHSKELCKILNGDKTIVVKKKVLKEMLK